MKRFLTLIIYVTLPLLLTAQQRELRFEQLPIDLNVNGNIITGIRQDKQGFFWISSLLNGLIKFDGYTTTKYEYAPFDPLSIPQNQIYTFLIDKDDTIWVGTPEGISRFDRRTEKFIRYNAKLIPGMPDFRNVGTINEDDDGNLWIGNYEGELWRYNKRTGQCLSLTSRLDYTREKGAAAEFHESIYCIYKDKKGNIWIGNTNGLHRANKRPGSGNENSFTHYQHDPANANSISHNEVLNIFEDSKGIIWVGTKFGLNSLDVSSGKITRYLPDPVNPSAITGREVSVWGRAIIEDPDSSLWIATGDGLNKLNKERTAFTHYFQNNSASFGVLSNMITTLGTDAGNNLLVSTTNGIYSLILNQKAFGLLQHDVNDINSISTNDILSVVEDKSGIVWI